MANQTFADKDMACDLLKDLNESHVFYANVINECSNQQLRQTIQQIRNSSEQFQFQLASLAQQKRYYEESPMASQQDIQQIRTKVNMS